MVTAVESPRAEPGTPLAPGLVLGQRFRVARFGMGEVWQAYDLKLRVDVALKTLRREVRDDERMLERLRGEVRAARDVVSPNVCRIFDLLDLEGHELVSMEYVDGRTLLDLLRERGPLQRGDTAFLNPLAFDSEGHWLATPHGSNIAFWWLGSDYPLVFQGLGRFSRLMFTPDGQSLVSWSRAANGESSVRLWPLVGEGAAEPRILLRGALGLECDIAIDPRGRNVVIAGNRGRIHLIPLDGGPPRQLEGYSDRVGLKAVAFSEDGRFVAAAPYNGPAEEKVVRVFELQTGAAQVLGPVPGVGEGYGGIFSLRFAGPDRILARVSKTGIVSFDLKTGAAPELVPRPELDDLFSHAVTGAAGAKRVGIRLLGTVARVGGR